MQRNETDIQKLLKAATRDAQLMALLFVLLGGVGVWLSFNTFRRDQVLMATSAVLLLGPGLVYLLAARGLTRADSHIVGFGLWMAVGHAGAIALCLAGAALLASLDLPWRIVAGLLTPAVFGAFFLPALAAFAYRLMRARRAARLAGVERGFTVEPVLPVALLDPPGQGCLTGDGPHHSPRIVLSTLSGGQRRFTLAAMKRKPNSTLLWTSLIAAGAGAAVAAHYLARRARAIDLAGKVCLITGGSRGLGLLLARRLVHAGARVVICARDEAEVNRARDELRAVDPTVLGVQCDITRPEQVAGLVEGIHAHFGPIDILINNAGIIQAGPIEHMTEADYQEAMAIHFWAPYYLTRTVLPDMKLRGGGRIVNISSIGGKIPAPHLAPYAASKFALTGFSQALRMELHKDNIYVTTVAPGLMRTGSPRNIWSKGQARKEYAWFKISDSLPGLSMSADRAADKIVDALVHGDADLTLTLVAKLGVKFHHLFTNTSLALAAMANHFLPAPGGIGAARVRGAQAESPASQGPLTRLTDEAARRNNEI